jgi:hypothetical protein
MCRKLASSYHNLFIRSHFPHNYNSILNPFEFQDTYIVLQYFDALLIFSVSKNKFRCRSVMGTAGLSPCIFNFSGVRFQGLIIQGASQLPTAPVDAWIKHTDHKQKLFSFSSPFRFRVSKLLMCYSSCLNF